MKKQRNLKLLKKTVITILLKPKQQSKQSKKKGGNKTKNRKEVHLSCRLQHDLNVRIFCGDLRSPSSQHILLSTHLILYHIISGKTKIVGKDKRKRTKNKQHEHAREHIED